MDALQVHHLVAHCLKHTLDLVIPSLMQGDLSQAGVGWVWLLKQRRQGGGVIPDVKALRERLRILRAKGVSQGCQVYLIHMLVGGEQPVR